ncbi:MAG: hypothetical protein LBS75_00575, partial [Synergistaceae bacterium]|nr:hypothetical protein [Synergistaceae bacterium]
AAGGVTIKKSAFLSGLTDSVKDSIDTETITSIPALTTRVGEGGGTALVSLKVNLDKYKGETLGSISVLKMEYDSINSVKMLNSAKTVETDETNETFKRVSSIGELIPGSYIWTDADGNEKLVSEKVAVGGGYYMSVAVEDDSDYDLDREEGTILVPLALAGANKGTEGGKNDDEPQSNDGGGGGCAAGEFGLTVVAAAAVLSAVSRKRRD